ncbi:unnamed protein product, partial [Rotaria sordida]
MIILPEDRIIGGPNATEHVDDSIPYVAKTPIFTHHDDNDK